MNKLPKELIKRIYYKFLSSKDRKPLFVKELDQISYTNYYCDYYYDAVNYDKAQISTYVEHDMMKIEIIEGLKSAGPTKNLDILVQKLYLATYYKVDHNFVNC